MYQPESYQEKVQLNEFNGSRFNMELFLEMGAGIRELISGW